MRALAEAGDVGGRDDTVTAVMKRLGGVLGALVLGLGLLTGCSGGSDSQGGQEPVGLQIGTLDSPEMRIMAEIYAGALRSVGTRVRTELRVGDYRELLADMSSLDVDLFPGFSGALVAELAPASTAIGADDVYQDLNRSLPQDVMVGDATPVTAQPQVFVAIDLAERTGVTELVDCAQLPPALPMVAAEDVEEETLSALADAGCDVGAVEVVESTAEAFERVATGAALGLLTALDAAGEGDEGPTGQVQALSVPAGESTREGMGAGPTEAAQETAADIPEPIGPRAEELVPVFRGPALDRTQLRTVNKVAGEITTADLATMATEVRDGADPAELAVNWLGERGL